MTIDAKIRCILGSMTISNGQTIRKLELYPPAQPQPDLGEPIWLNLGDEEEELYSIAYLVMLHGKYFLKM